MEIKRSILNFLERMKQFFLGWKYITFCLILFFIPVLLIFTNEGLPANILFVSFTGFILLIPYYISSHFETKKQEKLSMQHFGHKNMIFDYNDDSFAPAPQVVTKSFDVIPDKTIHLKNSNDFLLIKSYVEKYPNTGLSYKNRQGSVSHTFVVTTLQNHDYRSLPR